MTARIMLASCLALTALAGCSSSSKTVSETAKHWSTDNYVLDADASGRAENAARIVDLPPRAADTWSHDERRRTDPASA